MLKSYFAALPELSAAFPSLLYFIDCGAYHFQTRKPHFQTFKPPLVVNAPCRIIYIMYTKVSKRGRKRRFYSYFPHL